MRLSGAQSYFLEDSLQGPSQEKSRRRQQVEFWDKLLIQDEVWFMHTFNRDGGRGQALQELSWRSRPENHRDPRACRGLEETPSISAVYLRGDSFSVTAESIL